MAGYEFLNYTELNSRQLKQYQYALDHAWPPIIHDSPVLQEYLPKTQNCYPELQQFITSNGDILGFINTTHIHWNHPLDQLPDEGWDWLIKKGVHDNKPDLKPNVLGGLQIIVLKEHQGKGLSKLIIQRAKDLLKSKGYHSLIIPIRPTLKFKYPEMDMEQYLQLKDNGEILDPWIRTHIKGGARIIKICQTAMTICHPISYWESLLGRKIVSSGKYLIPGGINPVYMDLTKNIGIYLEDNIWIGYDS